MLSVFHRNLAGRAKLWYPYLDYDTKRDWDKTATKFKAHFNINDHDISDDEKREMVRCDLRSLMQGENESIGAYLERCEDLRVRANWLLGDDEKGEFEVGVINGMRSLSIKAKILSATGESDGLGGFRRVKKVVRALRYS
ncbi:hypothetical protein MW887_002176 [Aspergillus wentii]|nr:hypothetical protein MW887_002176 [Aspergillus wentii]